MWAPGGRVCAHLGELTWFKLTLVTPGGGDKTAWIWNRHICPWVGSGGCESRWGHSRSVLSGTKGGQVHTLPRLEESGWFFRTVLLCNHPTTLAWEDPVLLPLTLAQPWGGGAFRSLVDWHSAEKHPHGGTREMLPASCWPKRRGSELGPTGHMGLHHLHPSSGVRAVQGWPYQPVVTVWLQPLWPHAPSMMPTASVNGD